MFDHRKTVHSVIFEKPENLSNKMINSSKKLDRGLAFSKVCWLDLG